MINEKKPRRGYKLVKWVFGKEIEIPTEWKIVKLTDQDVLKLSSGESINNIQNKNKFPIYGSNGIIGFSDKFNEEDCILIGRVGASGSIHFLKQKAWITDNVLISKIGKKLDKKFTYYSLIYLDLSRFATKTAQPLLTQSILKLLKIPLPPLPEQQKIASILSDVDALIESTQM